MTRFDRLAAVVNRHHSMTIAVSGGIDSTLLAHLAHQVLGDRVSMVHAISPAVPAVATRRVKRHARQKGWQLKIIDAGEHNDPRYRANPVDRCYYCKLNLYDSIAKLFDGPIASGTNCDDLSDYRPGLGAAQEKQVVHPYVEAGFSKGDIYRLASQLKLSDLAELPAQPCLASRIETGIAVHAGDLGFVEKVEQAIHDSIGVSAVLRCRILHQGVMLELDEELLATKKVPGLSRMVEDLCAEEKRPFLGIRAYRQGAAFRQEGES